MSDREKARLRRDIHYLLALLPMWMSGDEEPTAMDVAAIGSWDQVEEIRERVEQIRETVSRL